MIILIITSEYVYDNIKLNETRKIVEHTLQECVQKHGTDYRKSVKVRCVAEFLGKLKNETKNITIEHYNIIGELNKVMQSSKSLIKLFRIIEMNILIRGRICKDVIYHYLECENNPILWEKIFM